MQNLSLFLALFCYVAIRSASTNFLWKIYIFLEVVFIIQYEIDSALSSLP